MGGAGSGIWKRVDGVKALPKRLGRARESDRFLREHGRKHEPKPAQRQRWVAIRADLLAKAADMIDVADPGLARLFRRVIENPNSEVTETLGIKKLRLP